MMDFQKATEIKRKTLNFIAAVQTMNHGKQYEIIVVGDDEPQYPQRKEWVEYILELAKELEDEIEDDPR